MKYDLMDGHVIVNQMASRTIDLKNETHIWFGL